MGPAGEVAAIEEHGRAGGCGGGVIFSRVGPLDAPQEVLEEAPAGKLPDLAKLDAAAAAAATEEEEAPPKQP